MSFCKNMESYISESQSQQSDSLFGSQLDYQQKILQQRKVFRCLNCNFIPLINLTNKDKTVCLSCLNGHYAEIPLNEYMQKGFNNSLDRVKCCVCNIKHEPKKKFKLCEECNCIFCKECLKIHKKQNSGHHFISVRKMDIICGLHQEKFTNFCEKCRKNLCNKCLTDHKGLKHKIINFEEISIMKNEISEFKENIRRENIALNEVIIIFNEKIRKLQNKFTEMVKNKKQVIKFKNNIIDTYELKDTNYQVIDNLNKLKFDFKNIYINENYDELKSIQYIFNFLAMNENENLNEDYNKNYSHQDSGYSFRNDNTEVKLYNNKKKTNSFHSENTEKDLIDEPAKNKNNNEIIDENKNTNKDIEKAKNNNEINNESKNSNKEIQKIKNNNEIIDESKNINKEIEEMKNINKEIEEIKNTNKEIKENKNNFIDNSPSFKSNKNTKNSRSVSKNRKKKRIKVYCDDKINDEENNNIGETNNNKNNNDSNNISNKENKKRFEVIDITAKIQTNEINKNNNYYNKYEKYENDDEIMMHHVEQDTFNPNFGKIKTENNFKKEEIYKEKNNIELGDSVDNNIHNIINKEFGSLSPVKNEDNNKENINNPPKKSQKEENYQNIFDDILADFGFPKKIPKKNKKPKNENQINIDNFSNEKIIDKIIDGKEEPENKDELERLKSSGRIKVKVDEEIKNEEKK